MMSALNVVGVMSVGKQSCLVTFVLIDHPLPQVKADVLFCGGRLWIVFPVRTDWVNCFCWDVGFSLARNLHVSMYSTNFLSTC